MMTARITSNQEKQFLRFVEDASYRALKEVNPDKDGLQRLIEHGGEFQAYLKTGISLFTAKAPDYDLARTILGKDFVSPEDIMKSFKDIVYTYYQLAQFGNTVPSQELLEWCRDNSYMLIAGPNCPMSLLEIRSLKKYFFFSKEGEDSWYDEQAFARKEKVETRWIMIRKEPAPKSISWNWYEQQDSLSEMEVVPNVAEVVWCATICKAVWNFFLLPNVYVRTSSRVSDGVSVIVSYPGARGIDVRKEWDERRCSNLGVSASRKF
jgi:hypothetical protein